LFGCRIPYWISGGGGLESDARAAQDDGHEFEIIDNVLILKVRRKEHNPRTARYLTGIYRKMTNLLFAYDIAPVIFQPMNF